MRRSLMMTTAALAAWSWVPGAGAQQPAPVTAPRGPEINVQQPPASVDVQQPAPEVTVEQRPPEIIIEQQAPQIIVRQAPPRIIVRQPAPEITVRQFQPQVIVRQREPEVIIEQADPEIQVEQPEPRVTVQQAQPRIDVQQAQPQVVIEQPEPRVDVQPVVPAPAPAVPPAPAPMAEAPAPIPEPAPEAAPADGPVAGVAPERMIGRPVVNAQGEPLGQIRDLLLGPAGTVETAIVDVGGYLGAPKEVAVPWGQVNAEPQEGPVTLPMDRQQLEAAPDHDYAEGANAVVGPAR